MASCKKNVIPAAPVPPTVSFTLELTEKEASGLRSLLGVMHCGATDRMGVTSVFDALAGHAPFDSNVSEVFRRHYSCKGGF